MKSKEIKEWLRENSSGIYRPAAEAADYIEKLEGVITSLPSINGTIHSNDVDIWNRMRDIADEILSDNIEGGCADRRYPS